MRRGIQLVCLVATLAGAPAARAGVAEWAFHAGSFNATKSASLAEAGLEARLATRAPGLQAVAGLTGNEEGGFWVHAGARYNLDGGGGWRFSPGAAVALYDEGDGKHLGGTVEFRTGLEISRRVGKRSRLGFRFYHLSNAGIYDQNPGANSVVLVWSVAAPDRP